MAVQSTINPITGSLTYPSTKAIATKQHMQVWLFNPDVPVVAPNYAWEQVDVLLFDLVNNAAVIADPIIFSGMSLVEVRVADNPDELTYAPSVISIISGIATEIVVVAGIAYEVTVVADEVESVKTCAGSIVDINTCAGSISAIRDAPVHAENSKQRAWESEAAKLTSDSYATEPEDTLVKIYTSNNDGTFSWTNITGVYSSLHWMRKSENSSLGLSYQGGWDASTGNYPTTRPPNGTGDPLERGDMFSIDVAGMINGIQYEVDDLIAHYDGEWSTIARATDWSEITNIPENVVRAMPSNPRFFGDLDTLITSQVVGIGESNANTPAGSDYGTMVVIRNGDVVTQTLYSMGNGTGFTWIRAMTQSVPWTDWKKQGHMKFDGTTLEITI